MLILVSAAEAFPELAVVVWVLAVPIFEFVAHARPFRSVNSVVEVEDTAAVDHRGRIGSLDLIKQRPLRRPRHAVNVSGISTARAPPPRPGGHGGPYTTPPHSGHVQVVTAAA